MDYVEYKNTVKSLESLLGLSKLDFWDTEAIHEGVCIVLKYLCKELILTDCENPLGNIKKLCELIDQGNEILLEIPEGIEDFKALLLGFSGEEINIPDYLLTTAWSNICTSLYDSAKCNYGVSLWELEHSGCGCLCGCSDEPEETDNLYSKLVGNGAMFTVDDNLSGCGC